MCIKPVQSCHTFKPDTLLSSTANRHALDIICLTRNCSESRGMQCFCLCRCRLKGSGQQLTVGQPVALTLHAADAYSNACWDSADKVHVGLCGPPGTGLTAAAVEDLRNGAYGISFTPHVAGQWTVLPRYCVQHLAKLTTACCLGMAETRREKTWQTLQCCAQHAVDVGADIVMNVHVCITACKSAA